ncbi:hypothetical protein MTX78_11455 [Hymenobacter tibetensis]|uniref:DUF6565 domain-containing protein n=1 Tax=Hymenobacter tibetensis TaxID=497967 RepID=A0ABY4CRR0_9BACT|nr:DUF6565 domain-containing protein [Hymenobacter tibetensis]UOG72742.1 hypothetical protein MTX78_11455 [Hymenobacter tibetensis]
MIQFRINTLLLATSLLAGGSTLALSSCSSNDKKEVSQEGQRAYDNLQAYVTEAETTPATTVPDTFAARLATVQRYAAEFDTARQAEIQRLQERYNQAQSGATATASVDTTGSMMATAAASAPVAPAPAGEAPAKLYKPTSPAAALTATNARATYEAFVQRVKANEDKYEIGDWRVINAEWRALDQKYDQIKGDVSGSDKAEIAKEKLKYAAFKSFDKTESRASQVGDLATGDKAEAKAKGEGVQVERAAKNTGSDVKNAGKEIGQGAVKVGKGAAEVGKDVGQGAVKAGKKVGGAVKDVFDGKDNKPAE